jgi:hypothetical protein
MKNYIESTSHTQTIGLLKKPQVKQYFQSETEHYEYNILIHYNVWTGLAAWN